MKEKLINIKNNFLDNLEKAINDAELKELETNTI